MMRILAISDLMYRAVITLYPTSFLRAHGEAMAQLFRDSCRDAFRQDGVVGLVAVWGRVLRELIPTIVSEHLTEANVMQRGLVREWSEGDARQRREGGVGVVDASGYINADGGDAIYEIVERLLAVDLRRIVLNCSDMKRVNSIGISRLRESLQQIDSRGGKATMCGVSSTIAKTFGVMGVTQLTDLYETEQDALVSVELD